MVWEYGIRGVVNRQPNWTVGVIAAPYMNRSENTDSEDRKKPDKGAESRIIDLTNWAQINT